MKLTAIPLLLLPLLGCPANVEVDADGGGNVGANVNAGGDWAGPQSCAEYCVRLQVMGCKVAGTPGAFCGCPNKPIPEECQDLFAEGFKCILEQAAVPANHCNANCDTTAAEECWVSHKND